MVILVATSLAGCGGGDEPNPAPQASSPIAGERATVPTIREVSALWYVNKGVTAVVRLTGAITANEAAFFVDPSLRVGQTPGPNQGVEPAERIGERGRHCYVVTARRLLPVKTPDPGSATTFGFAAKAEGKSGTLTDVAPARFSDGYVDGWQFAAARQMGCGDT
jgi:hypothetical protein